MRAVLFDLDGTLLDHDTASQTALVRTFPQADSPSGRRRWKTLEEQTVDRYLAGELTFQDQRRLRITTMAAELGLGAWTAAEADARFGQYLEHYEASWTAYPDVLPTLKALSGLTLGVLTNGDTAQQLLKIRRLGLTGLFGTVVISAEAGVAKPDPAVFQLACARLRLAPDQVAYVGDRLHTDALAATAAGLHGIWLNRTADPADHPSISTLTALPALLGRPPGLFG